MEKLKILNDFLLKVLFFSISFEYWSPIGGETETFSMVKLSTILYLISTIPFLSARLSIKSIKFFIFPIWLYLIIEAISSILHIEYVNKFNDIFNFNVFQFSLLLIFISNHLLFNKKLIPEILKYYSLGIIVLSFLFIFGIGIDIEFEEGISRLILFGENPNSIGIKAVMGLLIMLSLTLEKNIGLLLKIIFGLSVLPIITMISATASRGALFSLFIGSFIMVLLLRKRVHIKIPIFIITFFAGIYLINFFLSNELLYMRVMNTLEEGQTGRDELWDASSAIFYDNPIIGVGRSGFLPTMKIYYGEAMGAHNMFLEILASTGILGFITFLFFYLSMLKNALLNFIKEKSVLFFLLFCVISLHVFKAGGAMSSTFVWLVFILIISSTLHIKEKY